MTRIGVILFALELGLLPGCGNSAGTDFPNRLMGADGQEIFLDDLRMIANDDTLSEDEKIEALQELGIQDEALIEALLDLPA